MTDEEVRTFILDIAMDVKVSSLHNILHYLKYFHIFLKETAVSAPNCVDLFSYKAYQNLPSDWFGMGKRYFRLMFIYGREAPTNIKQGQLPHYSEKE